MSAPKPHRPVTARELAVQAALLVVLVAAVYPGTFLRGEITLPGDILFIANPWKVYAPEGFAGHRNPVLFDSICQHTLWYGEAQQAVARGEWPLWNHLQNAGMPLLANYQSAVFYPPRLFHLFFDNYTAITLFFLLRLWLCGATAYLCGRGMGLGVPASRFLSVAWMLGSYNLLWAYWPEPDVSAWLPVVFLGAEYILQGRYRRGFWVEAAGATLILLAGHPETAFTMGYGVGLYFFLRLVTLRRWGRALTSSLAAAGGAWALALAVTAVQWLPFVEYLAHSFTFGARPEGHSVITKLSPGALVAFWAPRFYGFTAHGNFWATGHSNYFALVYPGIAVWLAAVLVFVRRGDRARALCLLAPAVLGAMLAFDYAPVHWIQNLPVFSSMWYIWHIGFTVFALPLLGALGVERWFSRPGRARALAWPAGFALVIGLALWGFYAFQARVLHMLHVASYVRNQLWLALAFAVAGLALLALGRLPRLARFAPAALTAVLALDLLVAVHGHHVTVPRAYMFPRTQLTDYLRELPQPARVCAATAAIQAGLIPVYGIEQWLGYDGLYPLRVKRLQVAFGKDLWGTLEPACAIDYYLHLPEIAPLFPLGELDCYERLTELDGVEVYRNTCALPRAHLLPHAMVFDSVDALFAHARSDAFDPARTALLEAPPPGPVPDAPAAQPGTATIIEHASTRVMVEADVSAYSVLVLSDAFFPGWKAQLNGHPVELFPVHSAFRGILVQPGRHTVEYVYDPWSFRIGLWVSSVALLAAALAALCRLLYIGRNQGLAR